MSSQICRHSLQIATAPVPARPQTCVRRLPQKLQRSRACSSERAASTPSGVSACEPVATTSVASPTQFADKDARTADEPAGLALRATAEGAGAGFAVVFAFAPAPASSGLLDDLMDTLMAQPENLGDLAQGAAAQVQSTHRPVEVCRADERHGLRDRG